MRSVRFTDRSNDFCYIAATLENIAISLEKSLNFSDHRPAGRRGDNQFI
ncbi:MAG: hypothetical protein LBR79_00690 [Oscillospiraceae bacterium]|nr:hypothetical protein [Oscillospiraceae bacterium]